MKRKVACMLAAVLTVSVVAAGCGKTTEGQSDGNEDKKTESTSDSVTNGGNTFVVGFDAEYPPYGYMDENGNPISSLGDKVKVNGTIRYPVNKDVYTKCFNDNDTRKRSTLQAAYEKKEDGTLSLYGLYPAKFLGTLLDGADTRSPLDDYPVYRYADCLLLLAQAKAFLGEDPVEEINAVRKRAYGEDYFNAHPEVQYPNDNDAALYADNKSVKPDNAGAMEAVLKERMREFMVEGKRWYDLRLAGDEYVLEHTTAEATRLLWPIDKNTLTNNSALKQTPGYESSGGK